MSRWACIHITKEVRLMHIAEAVDGVEEAGGVACLAGLSGGLLGCRIDDLAKYRILLYLLQHPGVKGDPMWFAAALGFHSPVRTGEVLEEMARDGLLVKADGLGDGATFGLTHDSDLRRRLQTTCIHCLGSADHQRLLKRLAQRSVARVKADLRRKAKAC